MPKPDETHRRTTRIWNEAVISVPGWPSQQLTVPDFGKPRETIPLSGFSDAFQHDVEAHLDWLRGDDPFVENPPPKACKPRTIALRRKHIELAASAHVTRGHAINDLQSLSDLIVPDRVKEILRFYLEHKDGEKKDFARAIATALITIAQHWVKSDVAQIEELKKLRRCLGSPPSGLTPKNRDMLRQFQDEENLARLLSLPGTLFEEALATKVYNPRSAVKAQIALAIEILIMMPLRMVNLIELNLDRHIIRPGSKRGRVHIVVHQSETKNEEALEFELPAQMTGEAIYSRICKRTETALGQAINPHLFRDCAATSLAIEDPGHVRVAKDLLGHSRLETTEQYYIQAKTLDASRCYNKRIAALRSSLNCRPRGRPEPTPNGKYL